MQKNEGRVSKKTSQRWWLVAMLIILGLGVFASSAYFLGFPVGYQGGQNPYYGLTILFNRDGWDALHQWTGLAMILMVLIHIIVHRQWIKTMAVRCYKPQTCEIGKKNWLAQFNIYLNLTAGISFILVAVSGVYLMLMPGRSSAAIAPVIILDWYTWDVIHTWSGILMLIFILLHFYIHWGWITNVSNKMFKLRNSYKKFTLEGVKND
ncbi:MAG: DUF4405 domain-containing protein [Chloroflexi bacterium]|nr:DUF4405 domain-containing protein [Chloroflexota bacterium]